MNKHAKWYGPKQIIVIIYSAILLLAAACLVGGNNNTVFPAFAQAYGWNINLMNVVSGVGAMIVGFGVFVFSRASLNYGAKKVTVLTLFLTAALVFVQAYVKSYALYLVCIVLIGFISAGYEKCGAMIMTANWWPTKKGVVLGFSTMGTVAMNVVYVPFMPKLFHHFGVGNGYAVVGVLFIILAVVSIFIFKETPEEAGEYPDGDPNYEKNSAKVIEELKHYKSPFTVKVLLKSRDVWLIGISTLLAYMACMSFVASTIPTLLGFGYEYTFCTTVFAVTGIIAFVGSFLFGVIDQKIGTKKAFILFFIVLIIGFIFTLFMERSAVFVWLAAFVLFIAQGAIANLTPSYVATKYGRWDYGAAWSVIGFMYALGAGIGIMITGFITNPYVMYTLDIIALVIGIIMMAVSSDKFIGKKD